MVIVKRIDSNSNKFFFLGGGELGLLKKRSCPMVKLLLPICCCVDALLQKSNRQCLSPLGGRKNKKGARDWSTWRSRLPTSG
jgi:hypothetical protein